MLWMGQRNPINHQFGMGCFNPKNGMLTTGWSVFNWWFGFRWLHRRSSKWNKIVKNWCFWVTIFLWCKVTQEKRGDDVEWVKHQETWIKLGMWWQKFRRDEMWGCEKPPIRGVVERLKKKRPQSVAGHGGCLAPCDFRGFTVTRSFPSVRNKDMEAILQFVS